MLRAEKIHKTYVRVPVLQDVSLEVAKGSVLCLAGENGSGKSTLIKIISGTLAPDQGSIFLDDQDVTRLTPLARIERGLSIIYQDFALLPNLTVFENVTFLRSVSQRRRLNRFGQLRAQALQTLESMGVKIPVDALVDTLPVASQQLVAIARALHNESKVIIMDEPTSALTKREVRGLFKIVQDIRKQGVSFVFVTHKLEEIYEICDQVTVIRNGQIVTAGPIENYTSAQLSEAITGRQIRVENLQPPLPGTADSPQLEVSQLSLSPFYRNISFRVLAGEILGITGLLGSGRNELALTLGGKIKADRGTIRLAGKEIHLRGVREAQQNGIGYVPEDRLNEGLFLEQPIFDNMLIANLAARTRFGLLERAKERADGNQLIKQLGIKTQNGADYVQTLSGGNQQRVLFARCLDISPKLLVLNGPTMGVDVGSKHDLHLLIANLARDGAGVVVVSDDLPELLSVSHRILVMVNGEIANEHRVDGLQLETLSREITEN